MADSKRLRILTAIAGLLAAIDGTGSFVTSAGANVYKGFVPQLGPDDPYPCLAITVADDTVGSQKARVVQSLPIDISIVVPADAVTNDVWANVEAVLADVKRAIEGEDRTLGGLLGHERITRGSTRSLERESGGAVAGAVIRYDLPYFEEWGNPD